MRSLRAVALFIMYWSNHSWKILVVFFSSYCYLEYCTVVEVVSLLWGILMDGRHPKIISFPSMLVPSLYFEI